MYACVCVLMGVRGSTGDGCSFQVKKEGLESINEDTDDQPEGHNADFTIWGEQQAETSQPNSKHPGLSPVRPSSLTSKTWP